MGFGHGALARRLRAFTRDTRAGATAIASAAVTVMTVGGAALVIDHVWLVDQRDVLKTAAEAASIAATLDIDRQLADRPRIGDADLEAALLPLARRYVLVNLAHLPAKRFKHARKTLAVTLDLDRPNRTVGVTAQADLGGTLFSRHLALLGHHEGPEHTTVQAGVQSESTPVEVVLAIDVSGSMDYTPQSSVWSLTHSRLAIVKRAARDLVAVLDPNGYARVAVGIVPWYVAVRLDAQRAARWASAGWAAHAGTGAPLAAWGGCFRGLRIYGGVPRAPRPDAAALFAPPASAPFAQAACVESPLTRQLMPALLPLSTDRAAIEDGVDALATGGEGGTHSTLGVLWAQRMLEPAWKGVWGGAGIHPADRSTPEHATLRKAIVLLTDGRDTDNPGGVARADACAAAKSRGTEIFVISATEPKLVTPAFEQGLRACSSASDRAHPRGTRRPGVTYLFINNATRESIEAAFADIAKQLRTLRRIS